MRIAYFLATLLLPLTAAAGPFRDVIKRPPNPNRVSSTATKAFANVSHTIYLNPCLPDGCTVYPGDDNSLTNRSSIPASTTLLTPWPHGTTAWNNLVQCVKEMYAPFNIQVTDVDPGNANHFEVMVAGSADALGVPGAGGVAPFIPCEGEIQDNLLSFVFSADISNQDFLCWAAAQESAHTFGLDHELDAKDPMTYLTPPIKKEGFQDADAQCGEEAGQPRTCWCGGSTQNSYEYLMNMFGPADLLPATMSITEPANGDWVKPGFAVKFDVVSQLAFASASLQVDGKAMAALEANDPLEFTAPATITSGDHTITVVAKDKGNREVRGEVTVHVMGSCSAAAPCAANLNCVGGYCVPGGDVPGGLGTACTNNDDCLTGQCGDDGTNKLCTGACGAGAACPSGYTCLEAGASGVCWPAPADEGGCSSSGSSSPLFALLGLGALVMIVRRRR